MSYRYHRGYDDNPGMEMLQGVQAFGNAMRMGQQLEQGRMARVGAEAENYDRLGKAASFNPTGGILQGLGMMKG